MNDFSELEAELKKLRPTAASPELTTRIESALAEQPRSTPASGILSRRKSIRINWFSLGVGIAAAAGFVLLARMGNEPVPKKPQPVAEQKPSPSRPAVAGKFIPAGLTQVVYNTRDEGLVFTNGEERPVRRMHYRMQETLQWRQPATGASLRVSYPSEEVVFMPVSGQ